MSVCALQPRAAANATPARLALLGTGVVGTALCQRLQAGAVPPAIARPQLVYMANSRHAVPVSAGPLCTRSGDLGVGPSGRGPRLDDVDTALAGGGCRIVVDATASDEVAGRHAQWLASGIHVVTASKLGAGGRLCRWQAIQAAREAGRTAYGDSATVGAGLPMLASLRALVAGGDRIHALAGVLSGSLAWLLDGFDGGQDFSARVRAARAAGFTEPDPREDLGGTDVQRKLLILARSVGMRLDAAQVDVESLVPPRLARTDMDGLDAALSWLDAPMQARQRQADAAGLRLRHVARLDRDGRASVRLEALAADDVLVAGAGTDNRLAIWSDRYAERPLLIQGPGAGAGVTAAALLGDVLAIQSRYG